MKWYEGSIKEAVATSKSRKAIFVVFVEGKDDASAEFTRAINSIEVSSRLEQDDFVAIHLEGGSETYTFFAQIYQLVPIPSLFFIGENGIPLKIVTANESLSDLAEKIDVVLEKAGKSSKNASQNLISAEQKDAQPSVSSHDEKKAVGEVVATTSGDRVEDAEMATSKPATDTEGTDIVCDKKGDIAPAETDKQDDSEISANEQLPEGNKATEESSTKDLTSEEKLERAKQLIEVQRRQRVEEEEKKEREKELERRRLGHNVQKFKQIQQDFEVKHAHKERMKERAAEAAARAKIRKQIEQDRMERKQEELMLQQKVEEKQYSWQDCQRSSTTDVITRIQFRLPTGMLHTAQFASEDSLASLRSYVRQYIDVPFEEFLMCTRFPRRFLTCDDDDKTLLDLDLVPTAVILILPPKTGNATVPATQNSDIFSRVMWSLLAPIIGIYNYLVNYFTRIPRSTPGERRNESDAPSTSGSASSVDAAVSANLQNIANSGLLRRYLSNQGGTKIRAEGNIHRLHSGGDDNDENNTWNGNSTQQM